MDINVINAEITETSDIIMCNDDIQEIHILEDNKTNTETKAGSTQGGGKKQRYTWDDGSIYYGEWHDDMMHGEGTYNYSNGAVYEGQFRENLKHGHGTYTRGSNRYTGEFVQDTLEGQGELHMENGVYRGEFRNQQPNGIGWRNWPNEDIYEGEWHNGQMHGQGRYVHADKSEYNGQFVQDERDGQGTYKQSNGDVYQGQFQNGRIEGYGTWRWASGSEYTGYWKDGRSHGQGKERTGNKKEYEGQFYEGKKQGKGTMTRYSRCGMYNAVYEGIFHDGYRHGPGIVKFGGYCAYSGDWTKDRPTGGVLTLRNGDCHDGPSLCCTLHSPQDYDTVFDVLAEHNPQFRRYCLDVLCLTNDMEAYEMTKQLLGEETDVREAASNKKQKKKMKQVKRKQQAKLKKKEARDARVAAVAAEKHAQQQRSAAGREQRARAANKPLQKKAWVPETEVAVSAADLALPLSPPKPGSDVHNDASHTICVVCLDKPNTHAFSPCGHQCVCQKCAEELLEQKMNKCPLCTEIPHCVIKIYK